MRICLSLTFGLLLVAGSSGLADAHGHRGSHRVGGYNSHGKGSHYEGGIGIYGRQPREHHPRQLKSCTERRPCIKVHRLTVAPVIIGPTMHIAPVVTPVAAPAFITPVAPIPQSAPVDATAILIVVTFVVVTFAAAAFLAFLLLRALSALAKYIASIPMRLLRALDALAKYVACMAIRWIAGHLSARSDIPATGRRALRRAAK